MEKKDVIEVNPETGVIVVPTKNKFEDEGFSLAVDMTTAKTAYCSVKAVSEDEKAKMFNAMNNPDKRLSDCINMKIMAKDIYVEVVECTNEETGETTSCPRIVIIDDKGVSYQCVSVGIYSAVKKIIQIFGEPTWEKAIPMTVKQITKNTRKMLTLSVG